MQNWIVGVLLVVSISALADEINTFSSDAYEARSTLVNPAALGFQTELNGSALLTSFSYGYNKGRESDLSFGLAYGYIGLGLERMISPTQPWNRFSFASGIPISHQIFLGTRYSVTASDDSTLSGNHSFDMGLQYRPFKFISLGVQANRLNKDTTQWLGSVTLEPIDKLRASFEMDKDSNYQAFASYEVLPGLQFGGGYHKSYEYSIGLRFFLGRSTLFSDVQPNSDLRRWTAGFQTTVLPTKSFLAPKSVVKINLDSTLSEEGSQGSLFAKAEPSLFEILRRIERASNDSTVSGIVLKIESFPLGLAAAEEINQALLAFREKGKSIDVYLGNSTTREYLIASAGTKIYMEPSAELRILGPRSERFYFKGTLDKIGVQGEFLAKGEYKSAPETFTRKESSPQSREATLAELKAMEEGIQKTLSRSRKSVPHWNALIQHALFSANEAKTKGLIDEVLSHRGAQEVGAAEFDQLKNRLNLPPKVSVIVADGDIIQKRTRLLSIAGEGQVTPDKIAKKVNAAVADPLTKAIILRVTSPGGEILASQEIAAVIENAKKKKPVIISMGDVAASGGYMISAPATRIFADSLTITGSIGVFLGKVSLEKLYQKIDLKKEVIGSSPYAGLFSESKPWNPAERALMVRRMNDYYGSFVNYVAEKRKLTPEDAEKAAKGRVWAAKDALRLKLVDETGGLLDAVKYAANSVQLKEGDYEVELVREELGLFGLGDPDSLMMKEPSVLTEAVSLLGVKELQSMALLSGNPFLYWTPRMVRD